MFEVGVVGQFEAAHHLEGEFGPASRLHGHTYKVELRAQGEDLAPDGTLLDITVLRSALDEVLSRWHFQNLDGLEDFAGANSTAETVARQLFDAVAPALAGQNARSLSVRVWESPHAFAGYTGPV
ncbi:MAG: 6-pyruvoyl trahydropterin synthase family protein [Chloroflexota bacterium]